MKPNKTGTPMTTRRLTRAQRHARAEAMKKLYAEEHYWVKSTPIGPPLTELEKAERFLQKMRAEREQKTNNR